MKYRNLPHKPNKSNILKYEKKVMKVLPKFLEIFSKKKYHNDPGLIGDFIKEAISLAHISYYKGSSPEYVREILIDAADVAEKAVKSHYGFRNPYEYYMTWWLGILLNDKKLLLALKAVPKEKRGMRPVDYLIEGMLPDVTSVIREIAVGTKKKIEETLKMSESFLKMSLAEPSREEEALRYEPIIKGIRAVLKKDKKAWKEIQVKRKAVWIKEGKKYPSMSWFILDMEMLGLMRMAKDRKMKLESGNPHTPLDILTEKKSKKRKPLESLSRMIPK